MTRIVAAAAAGEKLDMQDLLMRSTLDSMFKVEFGVSLGVLSESSEEEGAAFAKAFDDASEQVAAPQHHRAAHGMEAPGHRGSGTRRENDWNDFWVQCPIL